MLKKIVTIRNTVARLTPEWLLLTYHFILAIVAVLIYRHPSRKLVVIGVTGTKGKTTTSLFIHAALTAVGKKTGLISTVEIRVGEDVQQNTMHMTMPGRGYVQKKLREMLDAGCTHAVIETPSEGIRQFRALGIQYDALVFTSLSPEHLVTHKTFEKYRATKGYIFKKLTKTKQKILQGKPIKKLAILNADDPHVAYFKKISEAPSIEQICFGLEHQATVQAKEIVETDTGSEFTLKEKHYKVPFPGMITVRNAIPAILIAREYADAQAEDINQGLSTVTTPGRLEEFKKGQAFKVFCDYAHEPLSIKSVCEALKRYTTENGKVIMVVGGLGGGRWKYNAEEIGETATKYADNVIITNVEPYFDDPKEIAEAVAKGAKKNKNKEWYIQLDRRKAIHEALATAKTGDVVIITGKGAEMTMPTKGKQLPWDERAIIQEEIQKVLQKN